MTHGRNDRSVNGRIGRALGLLAAASLTLGIAQQATAQSSTERVSVDEWSRLVWMNAEAGKSEVVFKLLEALPRNHASTAVTSLRDAVDLRERHIQDREATRVTRMEELRAELAERLDKKEYDKALNSAVELQDLSGDKQAFLRDPQIMDLVARAEDAARRAEASNEWLRAQSLYFRLSLLFENTKRYDVELKRLSQRLTYLRLYAPKTLHEMRDAERVRDGKDKLPPFNAIGEDWKERLKGIDRGMVLRAMMRADQANVDGVGLGEMIIGGLRAVENLATTGALTQTFPSLADMKARESFLSQLSAEARRYDNRANAGQFELRRAISTLLQANSTTVNLPEEAILQAFGDGAMLALDEFSSIIWPFDMNQFMRSTQGSFQGVGIQIQLDEAGNLKVVTPIEGTPAQRAGIKRGDIIRRIDKDSTLGVTLLQAVDRITGPAGTKVTLGVEREGVEDMIEVTLTRAQIPIYTVKGWERNGPSETDWNWFIDDQSGVGYIRLTQFTENTSRDFDNAIRAMQARGLKGLILDMRFNPGGLLSQAVAIANRFVDDGVIVSQHDARGFQTDRQVARRGLATLNRIPVAVLVNEGSASASEIVAGVLQDYAKSGRISAILVGATTYGKGSVQNVYDLADGVAALKLTTQYYKLPGGRLIHRRPGADGWGVAPDIEVKMLPKQVGNALELRQDADIVEFDGRGKPVLSDNRPDPKRLLSEGIDPQLETALLLLKSRILGQTEAQALLDAPIAPRGG
ncbi:MAG: PDZ domain-containing protein [Phycisphaeraceae bacterium]|nr:PDZ domain-containing protein [Phycisphaeraceae bacterium]